MAKRHFSLGDVQAAKLRQAYLRTKGGNAIREVLAANPRLELVRLPVAAPDLNPQEHVWNATREAASHNHALTALPALAAQFEYHLKHTRFPSSFLTHRGFDSVYPRSIC